VSTALLREPDALGIRRVTIHGGPFLIVPLPMRATARARHGQVRGVRGAVSHRRPHIG
jgi:hypothetical protein